MNTRVSAWNGGFLMDKLKYVKIEQEDGTLSENVPIGVEAQNVETGSAGGVC